MELSNGIRVREGWKIINDYNVSYSVTYHMAGRTRQQCRTRFLRTLDKSIKHGRWTDEEDLVRKRGKGQYKLIID